MASTPPQSRNIQATLDPCVVLMKDLISRYQHKWKDQGGIFSLAQGVVYWNPPEQCQVALRAALASSDNLLHMYGPDEGLPQLRSRLTSKIQTENGLCNHDVMITVGANQAYVNCVVALLDHTSTSVVFAPYYFNHYVRNRHGFVSPPLFLFSRFQMALQMTTNNILVGPCKHGIPDVSWLEQAFQSDPSIRMVTLTNPGNPTGILLDRQTVQKIVDVCKVHNCWLILDATYEYFANSFGACFSEPHVIHIFSFSKSYALAGYRCGYLVASRDADRLFDNLLKVQDTIPIAPSRVAQVAALGALDAGKEWVQQQYATLDASRQYILEALGSMPEIIGGSGAMYVMAKLPDGMEDDEAVAEQLVDFFGIAVIPGSFCGFPGYVLYAGSTVILIFFRPSRCKKFTSGTFASVMPILNHHDAKTQPNGCVEA